MITFKQKEYSNADVEVFHSFLSELNGFVVKCKILHWAASKNDIHTRLDEFHEILGDYQDALAEGFMGILGKIEASEIGCVLPDTNEPGEFIRLVESRTSAFHDLIPESVEFKGILSDNESFIQNIQKYKYLFSLCQ